MAQKLIVIDDLDGTEGAETYRFALEGVEFEIDLNEENLKQLREALLPFMSHARHRNGRVPPGLKEMLGAAMPPAAAAKSPVVDEPHSKTDLREVRAWSDRFGIKLGRGRVPQDVWDAWRENDVSLLHSGRLPQ